MPEKPFITLFRHSRLFNAFWTPAFAGGTEDEDLSASGTLRDEKDMVKREGCGSVPEE
jgi:hypothetical protein